MPVASRVTDAVATTRYRASQRQTRPTHPEANQINIADISAPTVLDPGATAQVRVQVANAALSSGVLNDDGCLNGANSGHQIRVTGRLAGVDATDAMCHTASGVLSGPNYRDYTFQLPAPDDPGDYDIAITVVGDETGQLMDDAFRPLTVRDPAAGDPPDPDPQPDPDPSPDPPAPGLLARLAKLLREGLSAVGEIVERIYGLLVSAGETIADALRRLLAWIGDNPLLIAAVATVAFVIAPAAVDFVVGNFTPIGWLQSAAGAIIPG